MPLQMVNKNLLLIITMFLLIIPISYSGTIMYNVSFATVNAIDFNSCTCDLNAASSGKLECTEAETCVWNTQLPNGSLTNWSLHLYNFKATGGATYYSWFLNGANSTTLTKQTYLFRINPDTTQSFNIGGVDEDTSLNPEGETHDYEIRHYDNGTLEVLDNGTMDVSTVVGGVGQINKDWQTWWLAKQDGTLDLTGFAVENLTEPSPSSEIMPITTKLILSKISKISAGKTGRFIMYR